jgi:MFS family permease
LFSLALLPLLMTNASLPSPVSTGRLGPKQLYRLSPLGFIGVVSAGLANASFSSMGPIFAQGIGATLGQTSTFMALGIFSGLLLQWPLGRLSDRIDRRWVMISTTLTASLICLFIIGTTSQISVLLFVSVVIYGSTSFTLYSLSASHINDYAPRDRLVQVSGGLQIAYGIGASIGPIIAAALMGHIGPRGLFIYLCVIQGVLGIFALYRMTRRASVSTEEKVVFVAQPSMQHNAKALYTAAVDEEIKPESDKTTPAAAETQTTKE